MCIRDRDTRLQPITESKLGEIQNGFRKGRSCSDNIHIINTILEKRRELNLATCIAFVDFEQAFDKVERKILWEILQRNGYPKNLISEVKSLFGHTDISLKW